MPLVLTQSGGDSSYGGVMMSIDDYQLGLKSGRFAGQLISAELDGLADVIILDYPDLPYLVQRADGLEDGVLESAPDAKIVGRYLGAVDSFAYNTVSNLLDDGVIFDVVVSINDAGTYGAIQALEEAGFESDQVIIIGIDAEQLAREYIREGNFMRGSVDLDRVTQTLATANSMIKLLSGGTIPEIIVVETGDVVTKEMLLAGEK